MENTIVSQLHWDVLLTTKGRPNYGDGFSLVVGQAMGQGFEDYVK